MTKETLYDLLDLETPDDFQYYENFAELMETDEDIDEDPLTDLFLEIDLDDFSDLCEGYFSELIEELPEDEEDFRTLTENIMRSIMNLAGEARSERGNEEYGRETAADLAREIVRVRKWYAKDLSVVCVNQETGASERKTVRDAAVLGRLETLGGDPYVCDFDDALDYELSDYVVTVSAHFGSEYDADGDDSYDDDDSYGDDSYETDPYEGNEEF